MKIKFGREDCGCFFENPSCFKGNKEAVWGDNQWLLKVECRIFMVKMEKLISRSLIRIKRFIMWQDIDA